MKKLLIILSVLAVFSCKNEAKKETTEVEEIEEVKEPKLVFQWQTDSVLVSSESVIYDKKNDILYVSSINDTEDGTQGEGYISKVNLKGEITNLNWVTGLNDPKGLGLHNDVLYVADVDKVEAIDITSGEKIKTYSIEGSEFLNDISTDENGAVYVTDSYKWKVHKIENETISAVLDSVVGPNGVLVDKNNFLVASWEGKELLNFNLEDKTSKVLSTGIEGLDGIEAVGDGNYLVSSWYGKLFLVDTQANKNILLLDTTEEKIGAADIEYIPEQNLLLVPTFYKNGVTAYKFEY